MHIFLKNNRFEVLSPVGFVDFDGLQIIENKQTFTVTVDNVSVTTTDNHQLLTTDNNWTEIAEIDTTLKHYYVRENKNPVIIKNIKQDVFDLINVDKGHAYITNGFISHNCALFISDELAHVNRRIQDEMWASILPTLSTGGSCVVMSTPNGDSDLFAKLWLEAKSMEDIVNRGGEESEEPFHPIFVDITEIPDRDEKWQQGMRNKLGDLTFRQEYLCTDYHTIITVKINNEIKQMKIGELYELFRIQGEEQVSHILT